MPNGRVDVQHMARLQQQLAQARNEISDLMAKAQEKNEVQTGS